MAFGVIRNGPQATEISPAEPSGSQLRRARSRPYSERKPTGVLGLYGSAHSADGCERLKGCRTATQLRLSSR
jgi:hypothetical protein